MKEEHDWKKHLENFKAEKLLKANKKIKRLQIDMRLMKERMEKIREENDKLRQTIKKQKDSTTSTKKMTNEDYLLYLDGVALSRKDYVESLKIHFANLYLRKLELERKKDTEHNRLLRHLNAGALSATLDDIENNCDIIGFPYK